MAKITGSLIVKTGFYSDKDGNTKFEYAEIGRIVEFETESGGKFEKLLIDAHVLNPQLAAQAAQVEKLRPGTDSREQARKLSGRVEVQMNYQR